MESAPRVLCYVLLFTQHLIAGTFTKDSKCFIDDESQSQNGSLLSSIPTGESVVEASVSGLCC